jgi:hypothetical protein
MEGPNGDFPWMSGVGLITAGIASFACWSLMTGMSPMAMEKEMMNPAFAGAIKMIQFHFYIFYLFCSSIFMGFYLLSQTAGFALGIQKTIFLESSSHQPIDPGCIHAFYRLAFFCK